MKSLPFNIPEAKNGSPCRQSLPPPLPSEQTKSFLTNRTEHQPEDWKQQQDLEKSPLKKEKPK